MNVTSSVHRLIAAAGIAAMVSFTSSVAAQNDSTFTYQGVLEQSGSPVTGSETIRFRVFDAQTGGTLFGETTQIVDVADGVFSTQLSFGPLNTIDPASAWLEIAVETGPGTFETLGRQRITAAPFSVNTRGLNVDGTGRVSIGTDSHEDILHVSGNNARILTESTSGFFSGIRSRLAGREYFTGVDTFPGAAGAGWHVFDNSGGGRRLALVPNGNFGIGVSSPDRRLHVRTDAATAGVMTVENSNSTGFAGTYFVGPGGGLDGYVGVTSGGPATWVGGDGMQIGSATDQDVIVTTGAAERMRVTSAGNVGIGTNDPMSLLSLDSPFGFAGSLEFLTGTGGDVRYDGGDDGDFFFEHSGDIDGEMSFGRTGGQRLLTVQNSGNVGVGISAPPAALSVVGFNDVIDFTQQGVHIGQIPFADGSGASVNLVGGSEGAQLRFYDTAQPGSCRLWYFPATGEIRMDGGILNGFRVATDLLVTANAFKPGGGAWSNLSDRNLKKNISELDGALDTMLALRGVTYEYKDAEAINELPGTRTGFIAQDVEKIMPDWVDENEDGIKRLSIRGFEAITVEAIREQQDQIISMQAEIDSLRAGKSMAGASVAWPMLIGCGLFGGIAVSRRRASKA